MSYCEECLRELNIRKKTLTTKLEKLKCKKSTYETQQKKN